MNLILQRRPSRGGCTIGELSVDGSFECFTLEDTVREKPGVPVGQWKVQNQTAIPAGKYRIVTDMSTRFQRVMLHILDVPGFAGIRMHSGNVATDTDGCVLVGQVVTPGALSIQRSALALEAIQPKIQAALDGGAEVWIEIANSPEAVT